MIGNIQKKRVCKVKIEGNLCLSCEEYKDLLEEDEFVKKKELQKQEEN